MQLMLIIILNPVMRLDKMQSLILISACISVCWTIGLTYAQFKASTPKQFGILATYENCEQNFQAFIKQVETYTDMKSCEQIQEIVVVWNCDQIKPEGIISAASSTKPVRIVTTPYSSVDFRFLLPKQSTAKVYFVASAQIIVQCEQLKRSFQNWQKKAVGDIGPLLTYATQSYDIDLRGQKFTYDPSLNGKFYTMSSMSATWVSRFFLQLYNLQTNWQISSMRQIVKQKNKCQVIALNFAINYYFPQLHPIYINDTVKVINTANSNVEQESACIKKFMEILGYNPMPIMVKIQQQSNYDRFESIADSYAIYLKKQQLVARLLQSQKTLPQVTAKQVQAMQQQIVDQIALTKPADKDVELKIKIQIQHQIDRLLKQNHQRNQSLQAISKQIEVLQTSTLLDPSYLRHKQKVEISINAMKYVSAASLIIIIVLALVFACWRQKKELPQYANFPETETSTKLKQQKRVSQRGNLPDSDSEDD